MYPKSKQPRQYAWVLRVAPIAKYNGPSKIILETVGRVSIAASHDEEVHLFSCRFL